MEYIFNVYTPKDSRVGSKIIRRIAKQYEGIERVPNKNRNAYTAPVIAPDVSRASEILKDVLRRIVQTEFSLNYFFSVETRNESTSLESLGMTKVLIAKADTG